VGSEKALRALEEAVTGAYAAAGLSRAPAAGACLGLAGAARTGDQAVIREWAGRFNLARHVEVTSDAVILLAAGTPEGWGLGVVAGTGSIAYGRTADGRTARAGGWGYLLGDEGSGYALVLAGLRAVTRAADGCGPLTRLTGDFLCKLGLSQPQDLIPALYRGDWDRAALAALAPLVLQAAEAQDAVAETIVGQSARDLALTATVVVYKLGLHPGAVPLALAGGVLMASASYRQRLLAALEDSGVCPAPVTLVEEPAVGAVRLAMANRIAVGTSGEAGGPGR
jgi:N-acetylglucosamine kinase-like BadF-type ATPase